MPPLGLRYALALSVALTAWPTVAAVGSDGDSASDPGALAASALLAVDRNRATIVDRIVNEWGDRLTAAPGGVSKAQLKEMLAAMRADQLLAASLAGSLDGLKAIVVAATPGAGKARIADAGGILPNALGDAAADLVYTPVSPCRLFDTRPSQNGLGTPTPGVRRTYGAITPIPQQGGPGGCAAAAGATVALIQIGALTPSGNGLLQAGPQGATSFPNALILYQPGDQYGATVAMPLNPANGQFDLLEQFAAADLYGDLLGYFKPAAGAFVQGGNSFGATAKLGTNDNNALELYANGARVMRYEPVAYSPNIVGGHASNTVDPAVYGQTIAGGGAGGTNCPDPVTNSYDRSCANRTYRGALATVSGGFSNSAYRVATVGGGQSNAASGELSTISGGGLNIAGGYSSTVSGGVRNAATGKGSFVAGGAQNMAAGGYSFAAGYRAKALAAGSFVFGDSTDADVTSNAPNQFLVAASGGIVMATNKNLSTGCFMLAGGGTWSCTSDRNAKRDFDDVDSIAILEGVARLPVSSWRFAGEAGEARHLGPTAQDFREAFGLGHDDRTIAAVDVQGVALAAIKGLNAKLLAAIEERDARLEKQERELARLRGAVEALAARTRFAGDPAPAE